MGKAAEEREASAFTLMTSPHCSWLASTVTQVLSRRVCDSLLHQVCVPQSQDPPDYRGWTFLPAGSQEPFLAPLLHPSFAASPSG